MIDIQIVGLRDIMGRFASVADHEMMEIQLGEAEKLAMTIEDVYRENAPRGETGKFRAGLTARATPSGVGFELAVETDDPQLRDWLKEGTGVAGPLGRRIVPKSAKMMRWFSWAGHGGGPFFARSTAGMKPNPWEEHALAEVEPLIDVVGSSIGQKVVIRLED